MEKDTDSRNVQAVRGRLNFAIAVNLFDWWGNKAHEQLNGFDFFDYCTPQSGNGLNGKRPVKFG